MATYLPDAPASRQDALDHERLSTLINSMADAVIATDEETRIVLCNGAALNILDLNTSIQGKLIAEVLKINDKEKKPIDVAALIQSTKTQTTSRDYRIPLSDDSDI